MSDFDEMDYHMTEDSRSEEDEDERLEELYSDANAEFKADSQSHRFDGLFSIESAMQTKTVWGFKAAKRLLKSALEQSNLDASTARYRQLLSYAIAVTSYDFERGVFEIVSLLESQISSLSVPQTEILSALFSVSVTDETLTSASARTAIKIAQLLVRLRPNHTSFGCLINLQHRLEPVFLELHVLEMELLWRMERLENMDAVYCKALSLEEGVVELQHMSSAHGTNFNRVSLLSMSDISVQETIVNPELGYYGRYLLRSNRPADALEYLAKAIKDEVTRIADEHHTACVQSLALVAYTSATDADDLLNKYSGRLDVAAIRRFAMAFLSEDVDGLERALVETEGTFKDRELRRLLRHYETVLKRKLRLRTSPLPADCWSNIFQCLTHPVWHELQTACKGFGPVLAPLLNHLHSDVLYASFKWRVGDNARWVIALHSRSGRATKEVPCDWPSDAMLARVVLPSTVIAI